MSTYKIQEQKKTGYKQWKTVGTYHQHEYENGLVLKDWDTWTQIARGSSSSVRLIRCYGVHNISVRITYNAGPVHKVAEV